MTRLRTLLALLAGALVLSGLTPLTPASAALEPGKFLVTTTVTDPGGAPAAVDVHVYEGSSYLMTEHFTDGQVRLALAAGEYRLGFYPLEPELEHEFYNNQPNRTAATPIGVEADTVLEPVELKRPPAITGRVLQDGRPVADAYVAAVPADNRFGGSHGAYTEADGTFAVQPPAGSWKILIEPDDLAREWFADAASFGSATPVTLGTTDVAIGEAIVGPGRSIVGRLVSTAGTPAERVQVAAYDADGQWVRYDLTDTDGHFVVPNLAAGTYRLLFTDPHGEFAQSWYGGTSMETATPVQLGSNEDLRLPKSALSSQEVPTPSGVDLTGVVRDRTGRALLNVSVDVFAKRPDGTFALAGGAVTNRSGRYYFTNLDRADPRDYWVHANPSSSIEKDDLGHLPAWYGGTTLENAASVAVIPGEPTEGIDFALERAAGLSGRVSYEDGNAARWTEVDVLDEHGEVVDGGHADRNGRYTVNQLQPGVPYFVRFYPGEGVVEWHADAASMAEARPVVLRGGTWTTLDAAVADRVRPVSPPRVTGQPLVGQRLTVFPGRWNASSNMTYDYQWRRGSTVVGRGTSYTPTAADLGKQLSVVVSATHEWYPSGSTTVTTAPIRHPSTTTLTGRAGSRGKVTLTVTVASKAAPTGTVTIRQGTRLLRTVTLRAAKATLTLRKQKTGTHRYTATYAGSTTVAPSTAVTTVKIRR